MSAERSCNVSRFDADHVRLGIPCSASQLLALGAGNYRQERKDRPSRSGTLCHHHVVVPRRRELLHDGDEAHGDCRLADGMGLPYRGDPLGRRNRPHLRKVQPRRSAVALVEKQKVRSRPPGKPRGLVISYGQLFLFEIRSNLAYRMWVHAGVAKWYTQSTQNRSGQPMRVQVSPPAQMQNMSAYGAIFVSDVDTMLECPHVRLLQ